MVSHMVQECDEKKLCHKLESIVEDVMMGRKSTPHCEKGGN